MWVQSHGWEDSLEEGIATHTSILVWRIHGQRAIGHGVAKSWTKLKRPSTQKFTKTGRVRIRNIKTLGKFNQDNLSFGETRLFSTQIQWKRNTGNTSVTWKCSTIFISSLNFCFCLRVLSWISQLDPQIRKWRRQWHPTPVLLPGKSHWRRSLVGCSPWGC